MSHPRVACEGVVQLPALRDHDMRAFLEEAVDDAATYPAPAAGHQRDLPFELHRSPSHLPTGFAPVTSTVSPAM